MAYSDYGGYAYRNGELALERSDAIVTSDGVMSSPGSFPGFSFPGHRDGRPYHVLLGDGPVMIGLAKTYACVIVGGQTKELAEVVVNPLPGSVDDGYLDMRPYEERDMAAVTDIDGCRIEVRTEEDGVYVHARLIQPDGTTWHGWSGYGVGAGHQDPGTEGSGIRDEKMRTFWPDAPVVDRS